MKSPNHPLPSGDRTMARLLMKALDTAGFAPHLASEIRTFDRHGDRRVQENLKQQSFAEASRLIAHYRALPEEQQPALWFTYHVYYKAPDWIGPLVSKALNIPYVIAEGSRAAKRAHGPWAFAHEGAEEALDQADAIFVMTAKDRKALEASRPPHQALIDLPPFIDAQEWPEPVSRRNQDAPKLLTVAMMREGDKLASYRILSQALDRITDLSWSLDIVGDGEAKAEVERFFSPLGNRVRFAGKIERKADLAAYYEGADLFVWPAVNEAYGMVLLEAQFFGCPVLAGDFGGVASVVKHGQTGMLTAPGDAEAFAQALRRCLKDREELRRLGLEAKRFIGEERLLDRAAERLHYALSSLTLSRGAWACAF
nr:glycosyltransferase family 4 protein [Microvirga solisilvae]